MKKNYYLSTFVNLKKIILILIMTFLSLSGYSQLYEGFEGGTIPSSWAVFDNGVGTAQSWGVTTTAANVYQGTHAAEVLRGQIGQGTTSEDWLVTPLQMIPANGILRFFTRSQILGDNGTLYQIRISATSQTDMSTFTTIQTYTESQLSTLAGTYEKKTINLNAYAGTGKYIAFVRVYTQSGITVSGDKWLIDNVAILAQCAEPADFTVTNISNTTATLSWTSNTPLYNVQYEYGPTGFTPGTGTVVTSVSNPYTLTGLAQDSDYEVYVYVNCAALPSPAVWSDVFAFKTLQTCPKPLTLSVPWSTVAPTTAVLEWNNGTPTDAQWEILLVKWYPLGDFGTPPPPPEAIPVLAPGDILFAPVTTPSPFTATGLQPTTIYYYYIRTVCSATDKSAWTGPIAFNTPTCDDADKCTYKFILTDTGSNGWNGARIQVRQNGNVVATMGSTITGAGPTTMSVQLCNNVPFDLTWTIPGTAPNEIGVSVKNSFDNVIYTMVPGTVTPPTVAPIVVYSAIGNCLPANDILKLVSFIDSNNNGLKEPSEASFSYGNFVYQQNNSGMLTNISSSNGNYFFYDINPANTYDFSYQINPEYTTYFAATATNFNDINIPLGSGTQTLYFPITLTQVYNDVSVTIVPFSQPRPGLIYINRIEYKNLGSATTSGTVTFTKPALTTITNINQTGTVSTPTGFTYDFTNLASNETRYFYVTMSVPAIPTVNINDILTCSASISAPANDINLVNNTFTNNQIVVGSYDPNDKMEAHGEKILFSSFSANEYLTYTIRFQNTGTANAINVRLEDVLDSKLNPTSIRMVSASHNYVMTRVNNAITWKFDDIQLPYATLNEQLSNGYVTFQVKLLPGFALGDIVPNHADIYFDANPAIITNTFNTEFVATLKTVTFNAENILIYPNPASDAINIRLENTMENLESMVLYDMIGKSVLKTVNIDSNQSAIDVSALAKGMYLVEITTVNQLKMTKKLIVK